MKKIAIGADKNGYELKEAVKKFLNDRGIDTEDYGAKSSEDEIAYYDVASIVASKVSKKQFQRGILVCGSGMGMAIIANKHPGVYASVCENRTAAERARSINNSNVLTLGGVVTTPEVAEDIVKTWLTTEFTQGWEKPISDWLENSMKSINRIEKERFKK
jgi:ribose 5-phosphate isomerase B